MQDRFKFRVFDKQINKMIEPTRHFNYCIVNGTIVGIESYSSEGAFYEKRITKEFDDAIIMQCTGLKDKNGKLIFEGDILKDKYGALHPISWNKKGFFEADTFAVAGFYNAIQEDMEVIGSIYEKLDLLEDK